MWKTCSQKSRKVQKVQNEIKEKRFQNDNVIGSHRFIYIYILVLSFPHKSCMKNQDTWQSIVNLTWVNILYYLNIKWIVINVAL